MHHSTCQGYALHKMAVVLTGFGTVTTVTTTLHHTNCHGMLTLHIIPITCLTHHMSYPSHVLPVTCLTHHMSYPSHAIPITMSYPSHVLPITRHTHHNVLPITCLTHHMPYPSKLNTLSRRARRQPAAARPDVLLCTGRGGSSCSIPVHF